MPNRRRGVSAKPWLRHEDTGMNPILQRILMAYRPLHLRGLLMDGQYRWPVADIPNERPESAPAARARRRTLLAALTGLHHGNFFNRSKS